MTLQLLTHAEELPVAWSAEPSAAQSRYAMVDVEFLPKPLDWHSIADRQLKELQLLPRGWAGPNSGPLGAGVVAYTRAILRSVMRPETPLPSFVPAHGGGVQLEWHRGGLDVELMIYRPLDAELSVMFHDGREPLEEEQLSNNFDRLSRILSEMG